MPPVAANPWTFFPTPDSRLIAETASNKFNECTKEIPFDHRMIAVRALASLEAKKGNPGRRSVENDIIRENNMFDIILIHNFTFSYRRKIESWCTADYFYVPTRKLRPLSELAYEAAWYAAPSDLQERIAYRPTEYSARNFLMAAVQK